MAKEYLTHSYVDHFLQAEIITRLASSDNPIRFSDLKEDGIENSLFMYHANKLIDRGLVSKQADGFKLTTKGARWANFAGINNSFRTLLPRPLIQFVIKAPDNNLLIASRKGQLKELLNDFMLPGDLHSFGSTATENADRILREMFGDNSFNPSLLTTAEIIQDYEDGFVYHTLSHVFEIILEIQELPISNDLFEYTWIAQDKITLSNQEFNNSKFLPMFIAKLPNLDQHEVFQIKQ